MKYKIIATKNKVSMKSSIETFDGELLQDKITKMLELGEPIEATDPMIYTPKEEGVMPQYDIRTDKWEIAEKAMTKVTEQKEIQRAEMQAMKAGKTIQKENLAKEGV